MLGNELAAASGASGEEAGQSERSVRGRGRLYLIWGTGGRSDAAEEACGRTSAAVIASTVVLRAEASRAGVEVNGGWRDASAPRRAGYRE